MPQPKRFACPREDAAMRVSAQLTVPGVKEKAPDEAGALLRKARVSIPVMLRLVRAFLLDADIVGLVLAQLGELHADLGEMQPRHLLVQCLRQQVDLLLVL